MGWSIRVGGNKTYMTRSLLDWCLNFAIFAHCFRWLQYEKINRKNQTTYITQERNVYMWVLHIAASARVCGCVCVCASVCACVCLKCLDKFQEWVPHTETWKILYQYVYAVTNFSWHCSVTCWDQSFRFLPVETLKNYGVVELNRKSRYSSPANYWCFRTHLQTSQKIWKSLCSKVSRLALI